MEQNYFTYLWKQADCPGYLGYTRENTREGGTLYLTSAYSWETLVGSQSRCVRRVPLLLKMYQRIWKHQLADPDKAWKVAHRHRSSSGAFSDSTTVHRNNLLHLRYFAKELTKCWHSWTSFWGFSLSLPPPAFFFNLMKCFFLFHVFFSLSFLAFVAFKW